MHNNRRSNIKFKVVLITFLLLIATIAFFLSPIFNIKNIETASLKKYNSKELSQSIESLKGTNGFISVFKSIKGLSSFNRIHDLGMPEEESLLIFNKPYLKDVRINYKFPNTVVLQAVERTPIFFAEYSGVYLYIDTDGYVVETFSQSEKPNMPLVKGLKVTSYKIGQPVIMDKADQLEKTIKLCSLMNSMSMLNNNIDIIDVTDYNNIQLFCAPTLKICIGNTDNLGYKLSMLKEIQKNSEYDGNSDGTIDFTVGKNAVFRPNVSN